MIEHLRTYANAYRTLMWIIMIPVAFLTGWIDSVTFVSLLSLWALVEAAWSTHRAKMAERKADNNGE